MHIVYLQACSGSGGWPMSVFLKPDLKPVSGGTYYPPEDRYGRRGFKSELLKWTKEARFGSYDKFNFISCCFSFTFLYIYFKHCIDKYLFNEHLLKYPVLL